MTSSAEQTPPGRALLRLAGVFTQVAGACCLLLGTIAFVLVHQNKTGGTGVAIGWGAAAMSALVFGGLMTRGGLIALLASALLDAGFGITLLVLDDDTLASLLRVLPADDIDMIADALLGAGVGMLVTAALCLAAIPQAIRYGRWLAQPPEFVAAGSTERGFPPPPVAAGSVWRTPAMAPVETRSRRRMYFALAGFAIGFGAGIGVLVSTTARQGDPVRRQTTETKDTKDTKDTNTKQTGSGSSAKTATPPVEITKTGSAGSNVKPTAGSDEGSIFKPATPTTTVDTMLADQKTALSHGDIPALLATVWPEAIGFGTDADEVAVGRAAIEAQLRHDLGDLPSAVAVRSTFSHMGSERGHAWIAQDLELAAAGRSKKRFAITQLAAAIGGKWQVVAWSWGVPVRDDVAERLAVLGTKPALKVIDSKVVGPKALDTAVRAAFASRDAFVAARSEREDAFNFGSGPNERIVGGSSIKKIIGGMSAEIRLHDGVHVVAGGAWDPAQRASPWVAVALVNADLLARTRARTDLTQTFRVMAVVVLEGSQWKLVQTQWSHGGPIR